MQFETNDALVRVMEDEGLGPFTLLKVTPKPTAKGRSVPASVVMEWGVADLEYEGDRERFMAWRVTAEGIEIFRGEGELDRFEECSIELGDAGGIDLRLEAAGMPATLTLGDVARRAGRVSGVFHDEKAKPIVHVNVDLREGALGSRRARACDDVMWVAVWRAPERLPGVVERNSRTTCSPPDPWPDSPPTR